MALRSSSRLIGGKAAALSGQLLSGRYCDSSEISRLPTIGLLIAPSTTMPRICAIAATVFSSE